MYVGCIVKMALGSYGDMIPKATVLDDTYTKGYASFSKINDYTEYVGIRSGSEANLANGFGRMDVTYSVNTTEASVGSRLQYQGPWEEDSTLT